MLPAPPLTLTDCLIAADWCDDQGFTEYAERLRAMAAEPPMCDGSRLYAGSTAISRVDGGGVRGWSDSSTQDDCLIWASSSVFDHRHRTESLSSSRTGRRRVSN